MDNWLNETAILWKATSEEERFFLSGRLAHLVNKNRAVLKSLERDLPKDHRKYKVEVLLPMISRAVDRIESGNYGTCLSCGNSIPKERLELRPESERCVNCQEKEDRENERR